MVLLVALHCVIVTFCLFNRYWSPTIDYRLFEHKATLNLLYLQTVSEVELGWVVAEADTKKALALMQARGAKLEVSQ